MRRALRRGVTQAIDALSIQALSLLDLVQRLLAMLALGALIGWDRERKDKPAGLRTHMLVLARRLSA